MNSAHRRRQPVTLSIVAAAVSACVALPACSTFSSDGGFDRVAAAAKTDLNLEVRWPRSSDERAKVHAQVAALRAHPLGPDDAVQIALLDNHALQADFQELGVSEADLVQSGRLPNPTFTLRHSSGAGLYDIEETLTFNVLSLLTAPYIHRAERQRFAQVQDATIIKVVQLAERTRTAYFSSVAAHDSLEYARQVTDAAEASAEIAHRMQAAGNWNRLDEFRQQGFYSQSLQQLARAQLADDTARTELNRLLAIDEAGPELELAAHLPALPQAASDPANLEQTALEGRIDLQLLRARMDELARRLKLTRATGLINVLDAGPTRVREGTRDQPYESGYDVSLEVPLFDTGDARARKAEAIYTQSLERFAQAAIDARAEIHGALSRCHGAYALARRQHDEIMPLSKQVAAQDLLRYNASQLSVFDLLADARAQIDSVNQGIETLRDYWIAKAHLDAALIANSSD